jgi:alpha-tubulin suppressor-like RCC1 family protein
MRPAPLRAAAALLVASLAACDDGPSGPPKEAAGSMVIDPTPAVRLPPGVELRPVLELYDTLGQRLPTPSRSEFQWLSSNTTVATVSEDGVIRTLDAAGAGTVAEIRVSYGSALAFLTVLKSEPPVAAKIVPTATVTPGAQQLLFGVAESPQGEDEPSHITIFTLIEGGSIARLARVGCSPPGTDCIGTAPDMAWLITDAPGRVVVRAVMDGLVANQTITVRTVDFVSVTAGNDHTCGVTSDEALFCWGGPLQPGTPTEKRRPGYTQIQAEVERTCGIDADGLAQCWRLRGDTVPHPVSSTHRFTRLSVGTLVSCGLEAGGKAWCWGENGSGQLGDGSRIASPAPVAVSGDLSFTDIAAGSLHTCGLVAGGAAYCWGTNMDGVLGDTTTLADTCGSSPCSTTPIPAAEGQAFEQIIVGEGYSCGRTAEGPAWCWGKPGLIGPAPTGPPGTAELVAGGAPFSSLAGGDRHLCGVRQDGVGVCWGDNRSGQTGQTPGDLVQVPTPIAGGHTFTSLDLGNNHTCGLTDDGLYCWGDNGFGQLGVLSLVGSGPVRVTGQD